MNLSRRWVGGLVAVVGVAAAAGCGGGPAGVSLSGAVTYEGKPVAHGNISLLPAEGKGSTAGGPITDGKYKIDKVAPGKYTALISSSSGSSASQSQTSEGMRNMPKFDPATSISPTAAGNNQTIDVGTADSTRDFALTKSDGGKR